MFRPQNSFQMRTMAGFPEFLPQLVTLEERWTGGVVLHESFRWILEGYAKKEREGNP